MAGFHHRSSAQRKQPAATTKKTKKVASSGGAAKQKRQTQRLTSAKKISEGGERSPVHVAVVVFNETLADMAGLWTHLTGAAFDQTQTQVQVTETTQLAGERQLAVVSLGLTKEATLDACKTADVLLAVFGVTGKVDFDHSVFSDRGYDLLKTLKMQGLPGLVLGGHVEVGNFALDKISARNFQRYFESEFSADQKHHRLIGNLADVAVRTRNFRSLPRLELSAWRRSAGFMQPLRSEISPTADQVVAVQGWTRGLGFAPGNFVAVTGQTLPFVVLRVVAAETGDCESQAISDSQLSELREALAAAVRPREEGEQCVFTEDERKLFEDERSGHDDEEDEEEGEWSGASDADEAEAEDSGLRQREDVETRSREEMDFPDEVDTPTTTPARTRFQKFRGLRSLRTAHWDRYEELPADFSQIWEFANPESLARQGAEKLREGNAGSSGKKVVLYLQRADAFMGVHGASDATTGTVGAVTQVSTLQEHENKVTLMHVKLQRVAESGETEIRSKNEFVVQVGFRRFPVRANFSEQIKGRETDLCKYLRTVPVKDTASSFVASFYAPACFGQQPVLLFDLQGTLLMWGSTMSVKPSKPIILKRVLLTGYPVKTHNKAAVVRYMFFNPEDIAWFKPVELFTKKGLRGNIVEAVGLKGHMKCRFNGVIHQDDVVCLPLYKRVYPKWHPATWGM